MCNRFSDPVCAAHEPALRAEVVAARERVLALTSKLTHIDAELAVDVHEQDLGALTRFHQEAQADLQIDRSTVATDLRTAVEEFKAVRARHDQTSHGLAALKATIGRHDLTPQQRLELGARHAVAARRRAAADLRWKQSAAWAEDRLRAAQGTKRSGRYIDMVATRRAAENGSQWPPPEGSGRAGWDITSAALTLAALSDVDAPHPEITFSIPAVIDARYRTPAHAGWHPLLAAHYANLPTVLLPPGPVPLLHRAAHTGKPWRATISELVGLLRSCGPDSWFVDDSAAVPVHDAVAGQRWDTARITGPLQLIDSTGTALSDPHLSGWVFVRESDARMIITDTHPHAKAAS